MSAVTHWDPSESVKLFLSVSDDLPNKHPEEWSAWLPSISDSISKFCCLNQFISIGIWKQNLYGKGMEFRTKLLAKTIHLLYKWAFHPGEIGTVLLICRASASPWRSTAALPSFIVWLLVLLQECWVYPNRGMCLNGPGQPNWDAAFLTY